MNASRYSRDHLRLVSDVASSPSNAQGRARKMTASRRKASAPTKQARIDKLLKRKSGATLAQLMTATGWQAHSVRAALSRMRKSGVVVESTQNKKRVRVYRLIEDDLDPSSSSSA